MGGASQVGIKRLPRPSLILEFETVAPSESLDQEVRGVFLSAEVCSGEVLIKLISLGFVQGKN